MDPHICKNCGNHFSGKYCNACGEKVYTQADKKIKYLVADVFHFISHFEGKFLLTVKTILTKPGKFSFDYCDGIRNKYFKPLSFFLLLVIIYLIFPIAQGLNMSLSSHVNASTYSGYAKSEVIKLLRVKHFSEDFLIESFHKKSEIVSKLLLVLIIPLMAWLTWAITRKKQKLYFDHFIFSTEINSFMVLWGFLILPLLSGLVYWIISLLTKKEYFSDIAFAVILISFICIFLFMASMRFFSFRVWQSLLFSIIYVAVYVSIIQFVYKFLLFFITIKLIH
ncbi:MAG: DUF3667 domain-containing protein [Ferruginibacter sp.]